MNIKLELLKGCIKDAIFQNLEYLDIDIDEIADTNAIKILEQIALVIRDPRLEDFDVVEQIVTIFEDNNISAGTRHDFG